MDPRLERAVERWREARLLDGATAERIRAWEAEHGERAESRLGVWVLAIGGLLLAAGILLFVAAHWDELSPWQRFALVTGTTGALHVAGALVAEKHGATAMTLHAVGTAAFGGAIFLIGQSFHLQIEWAAGVGLWALGAVVACALRRDWPQVLWTALLVPAWVISEWAALPEPRMRHFAGVGFALLPLALVYLGAEKRDASVTWRSALARFGAVALVPVGIWQVFAGNELGGEASNLWLVLSLAAPPAFAFALGRREAVYGAAASVFAALLLAAQRADAPEALIYLLLLAASVGVVAWGVRERSRLRANVGTLAAGVSITFFYFSSVFDKLGRSLGLIGLGVLFIGGGYALERTRRALVKQIEEARA